MGFLEGDECGRALGMVQDSVGAEVLEEAFDNELSVIVDRVYRAHQDLSL